MTERDDLKAHLEALRAALDKLATQRGEVVAMQATLDRLTTERQQLADVVERMKQRVAGSDESE
jgi:flagellin-like hook-associated protein FlgL